MVLLYIINESIIYDSQVHLISYVNGDKMVALPLPASHCFKILLENQGAIISQDELLKRVWNERGMNVNANTLHQNISLLRKALAHIDGGREMIKTIPKRGFTISSDTIIERKESVTDVNEELHEIAEINHPVVDLTEQHIKKVYFSKRKKTAIFSVVGICLIVLLVVYFSFSAKSDYFSSYIEINSVDKCRIFVTSIGEDQGVFQRLISRAAVDCSSKRWVYITGNHVSEYPSLIACNNKPGSITNAKCQSFYFIN